MQKSNCIAAIRLPLMDSAICTAAVGFSSASFSMPAVLDKHLISRLENSLTMTLKRECRVA